MKRLKLPVRHGESGNCFKDEHRDVHVDNNPNSFMTITAPMWVKQGKVVGRGNYYHWIQENRPMGDTHSQLSNSFQNMNLVNQKGYDGLP